MFNDNLKVITVAFLFLIFIYQANNFMNLHSQSQIELFYTAIISKLNLPDIYCMKWKIFLLLL